MINAPIPPARIRAIAEFAQSYSMTATHRLVLKPKEERRLLRGHLWVYRNELEPVAAEIPDGALADIVSDRGRFIGRGYYQAEGGIAARVLTFDDRPIAAAFFAERIAGALRLRSALYPGETVYRWIFGESDGLPGFVADRYGAVVSAQASSKFYADAAGPIANAFLAFEGVEGVRLSTPISAETFGNVPRPVRCSVNGLAFDVDPVAGQKTGLFLDQRENWALLRPFAKGARIFDGHCYVGAWACHAARWGAREVVGVDTSAPAIEAAERHAAINGVAERCRFERAGVQTVLERGETWDVAILDPPALAKARTQAEKAIGLYQALNRDALKCLVPGGVLITSSCSHFVSAEAFVEMLKRAASAAQRRARVLCMRGAATDHPVLLSMPETAYLKCVVLQVE